MLYNYFNKLSIDEDKKNQIVELLLEINRQQAEIIEQLKNEINPIVA